MIRNTPSIRHRPRLFMAAVLAAFSGAYPLADFASANDPIEVYLDMPIRELLSLKVVSILKKDQAAHRAASAVFVITGEDIRRSGATNIPELLRMVPGLDVARINASKWAVSTRGFNRLWSNKLLVMMDGRTLYDPLFSGVYWDLQDTVLEDIERIEVIRGPGAALWGANAVNGVINIVTRNAADTRGGLATGELGNRGQGRAAVRYGGSLGGGADLRLYAKDSRQGESTLVGGGEAHDAWHGTKAGFRLDWQHSARDHLTLTGDLYDAGFDRTSVRESLAPPTRTLVDDREDARGGNILARWQRTLTPGSEFTLQAYYDHADRDFLTYRDRRDILDLDFQHAFPLGVRHKLLWGLGFRYYYDRADGSLAVSFEPAQRDDRLYSAFVQDDITLLPERLQLTWGVRLEDNDYSGFEWQPNLRLAWTPDRRRTLWASVSRAVHTPSRFEHDIQISIPAPGFPVPSLVAIIGDEGVESEKLIAYEAGIRQVAGDGLYLDATLFYNEYDRLLDTRPGVPLCQPSGTAPPCFLPGDNHLLIPSLFDSGLRGETYGLELATEYRAADWWTLKGSYSYLETEFHPTAGSIDDPSLQGAAPRHKGSLRSLMDLGDDWELDLWLRLVDRLPTHDIDGYATLDARLAWRPHPDLELSIVGQNLLRPRQHEFSSLQDGTPPTYAERLVYGKVVVRF